MVKSRSPVDCGAPSLILASGSLSFSMREWGWYLESLLANTGCSTTYIGQVMAREKNAEPDAEYATRVGALSMLLNSAVATAAGALLPYLSRRDTRLLRVQDEDEEEETTRLRGLIYEWRAEAAKKGKTMRLPTLPVLYRTIWIGALVLFTILTMSTFLVTSTIGVSVLRPWCWSSLEADRPS